MKVGFTGTRTGMTIDQWQSFTERILDYLTTEWHDGDCIGADDQAHKVVEGFIREVAEFFPVMHGHPCNLHDRFKAFNDFDVMHPVKPPLVRNRDIVDSVDMMFAAPDGFEEIPVGSGTWATIRYARRVKKPLMILWPDGTVTGERLSWSDAMET